MTTKNRLAVGAVMVLALAGCDQDPFPESGNITTTPPVVPETVIPPLVLDVPATPELYEGRTTEIPVQVTVREGGTPIVEAFDLPAGATYDQAKGKLVWTPSFDAGNDSGNPSVRSRTYPVRFQLRSTADRKTMIQRNMLLTVHDVPRVFEIKAATSEAKVREGEELKVEVELTSEDFPQGPFQLHVGGLPPGASVVKNAADPKKLTLVYTPGTEVVKFPNAKYDGRYYSEFDVEVTAADPRGTVSVMKQKWKIYDNRLNPRISTPIKVSQGLRAVFTVAAEDPNGEMQPQIKIANRPTDRGSPPRDLGTFDVQSVQLPAEAGARPVAGISVSWTDVPVELNNTTYTMNVVACVRNSPTSMGACTTQPVQIELKDRVYQAPAISRDQWTLGTVKYLKVGESIRVPLKTVDTESSLALADSRVAIFPESMRSEVSYVNGELIVKPTSTGFKQFNVTATSVMGMARTESFLMEALRADWPKTLVLGESLSNTEIGKILPMIDGFQVVNPGLQVLDERTLAAREVLIVSTSSLKEADLDSKILEALERASQSVKTVIITSPMASIFTGALAKELSGLGLGFEGRFKSLPGAPTLASVNLFALPTSGLEQPTKKVKLTGKLTDESESPLVLKLAGTSCASVIKLGKDVNDTAAYTVGAKCRRANGGNLVFLGFELGDAEPHSSEPNAVRNWVQKLIKP